MGEKVAAGRLRGKISPMTSFLPCRPSTTSFLHFQTLPRCSRGSPTYRRGPPTGSRVAPTYRRTPPTDAGGSPTYGARRLHIGLTRLWVISYLLRVPRTCLCRRRPARIHRQTGPLLGGVRRYVGLAGCFCREYKLKIGKRKTHH